MFSFEVACWYCLRYFSSLHQPPCPPCLASRSSLAASSSRALASLSSLSACSAFSHDSLSILASSAVRLRAAVRQFSLSRLYLKHYDTRNRNSFTYRLIFYISLCIILSNFLWTFDYLWRLVAISATLPSSLFLSCSKLSLSRLFTRSWSLSNAMNS